MLWSALDICDEQAVSDMVKRTVDTFGSVDILLNNAVIPSVILTPMTSAIPENIRLEKASNVPHQTLG